VLEDRDILVVDKPAGGSSNRCPVKQAAKSRCWHLVADHLRTRVRVRPLVVHRIDRDTSGLVLSR